MPPATFILVGLIFALLAVLGVYVYAVEDAFRLARRGRNLPVTRLQLAVAASVDFTEEGLT